MVVSAYEGSNNTTIVSGYSDAHSVKGAIIELGIYIMENISETEGEAMIRYTTDCMAEDTDPNNYCLTVSRAVIKEARESAQHTVHSSYMWYVYARLCNENL